MSEALVLELREALQRQKDPTRARGAADYMKVALPFWGVPLPELRKRTKQKLRQHPISDFSDYKATLETLFFNASHQEERYAALAIAGDRTCRQFQTRRALPMYRKMITRAAWWDLVDDVSTRVGEVLLADPERVSKTLRQWAQHKNIWLRRASIICQRKLKQDTDLELLFACIEPSLDRQEFFLRKGIGWALRSLAWHDPEQVLRYVTQNRARLSPLSKKEALKNLLKQGKLKEIP